jgi:lysine 6-dehydrogenase
MNIAVVGAGSVGAAITRLLCAEERVKSVHVIDRNGNALESVAALVNHPKLAIHRVKIEREVSILGLIKGAEIIISALPFKQNLKLAEIAIKVGAHYIDLGGDDETYLSQLKLDGAAKAAHRWVIPNCGLAPGLSNILAMHGVESFDSVDTVQIRAAGLPKNPVPPLNYQLGFSPQGLVNEYLSTSVILENGQLKEVPALEGVEEVMLQSRPELGILEAFYTAGAATTLARHLAGKVQSLNFKTMRYKGHRDIIKSLFELGFNSPQIIDVRVNLSFRDLLVRQLSKYLPTGGDDFVAMKVRIKGQKDGASVTRDYEMYQESDKVRGMSAMMLSTAVPSVVMAMMIADGSLGQAGGVSAPEFVVPKQEFYDRIKKMGLRLQQTESRSS